MSQKGRSADLLLNIVTLATAKFRFKVDGKLSELTEIKARKVNGKPRPGIPGSNTYYLVERIKYYKLEPGKHTFRIEVRGGSKE